MKALNPSRVDLSAIEKFIKEISDPPSESDSQIEVDDDLFVDDVDQDSSANLFEDDVADRQLPASFGDLTDEDFPLFVPFKKLVSMVRVHLGLPEDPSKLDRELVERNADFERFRRIFNSLSPSLKKDIDDSLAFSEIMGIIKGSEEAARSPEGYLTREQYISSSTKAYVAFKYNRDGIYDLFEAYSARKLQYQDSEEVLRQDELDR
jgi:hypothetical protein